MMSELPIYDDEAFFDAYKEMARSQGLAYAGEWQQFQQMIPPVSGKSVLDLGCGMGWHCRYLAEHGAASVLGIDISEKMLQEARERNTAAQIEYRRCGLEAFEYPARTYDLVISNLVLHYLEDLEGIYRRVFETLKAGGTFLFNIEHPAFTAGVSQEMIRDEAGQALYWPLDDYYYPGPRKTQFLGHTVMKYHHTLTQILNPLIQIGFTITEIWEAMPPESMRNLPGFEDEMRRPMMLLVKAEKQEPEIPPRYVEFGTYGGEKITWRVLEEKDGSELLISKLGLDAACYNFSKENGNAWESSDLRKRLNEAFCSEAFNKEETALLLPDVRGDKVSLLSVDEVRKYFDDDPDRICYASEYGKSRGIWSNDYGVGWWWLRTPGPAEGLAACVLSDGYVYAQGDDMTCKDRMVRPVIRIKK